MTDVIPGLKDLLSTSLVSSPYNPTSNQRERFLIDSLASKVRQWEVGNMPFEALEAAFEQEDLGDFDFRQWFQDQVDAGEYEAPLDQVQDKEMDN